MGPALGEDGVTIESLRRLSGGASRETWSFDARLGDGRVEPLILRRDPPSAPRGGLSQEAQLLVAAGIAGVPVPAVLVASDDPSLLDAPFLVMARVEGETIPRRILRDPAYAEARAGLAAQCGQVLGAIHAIPPASVPGLEAPAQAHPAADQVERWRQVLDELGHPHPALELGLAWLATHLPEPSTAAPTVVHGDFRNGNLLVGPDGIRAVLDWELAHLGDPLEDLGWLCVKSWRFGAVPPVGGFGSRQELTCAYTEATGRGVGSEELRWWETLGTLKWGIMCIMQTTAHLSGLVRSVELAAIGRRVCEVEWDLLKLLP